MTQIVDIEGLAKILNCEKSTLLKHWRRYPHFFIGEAQTAKGVRFDATDVINHLKAQYYGNLGSTNEVMERPYSSKRLSTKNQDWIQNQSGGFGMGTYNKKSSKKIIPFSADPNNLLAGLK